MGSLQDQLNKKLQERNKANNLNVNNSNNNTNNQSTSRPNLLKPAKG